MFEDLIGKFAEHFAPETRKHVLPSISMVYDVVLSARFYYGNKCKSDGSKWCNRKRERVTVKYEEFTNHLFAQRLHYELRATHTRAVPYEFMTMTSDAELFFLSGRRRPSLHPKRFWGAWRLLERSSMFYNRILCLKYFVGSPNSKSSGNAVNRIIIIFGCCAWMCLYRYRNSERRTTTTITSQKHVFWRVNRATTLWIGIRYVCHTPAAPSPRSMQMAFCENSLVCTCRRRTLSQNSAHSMDEDVLDACRQHIWSSSFTFTRFI